MDTPSMIARLDHFADHVIDLVEQMPNTLVGRHIGGQLLRSGTSVAANYEEACGAESRADFVHKMQVSLKEARESHFWHRRLAQRDYPMRAQAEALCEEASELVLIFSKSVITAKRGKPSDR